MSRLMRLVHMGIQRAIVTNKKIKTPPYHLRSNDQVSDVRSSQLLSFLRFLEQLPCGLHCTLFSDASTVKYDLPCPLCHSKPAGFTDINKGGRGEVPIP